MRIWADVVGYLITLVCGVSTFVAGISTDFFGLLQNQTNAGFAALGVSLLIILAGDRITCGLRDQAAIKEVSRIVGTTMSRAPVLDVVIEFPNCNDAIEYLCSRLPYACTVLNTRVSDTGVAPRTDIGDKWSKIIAKRVKAGLVFKDIVSPTFNEYAKQLESACSNAGGSYNYTVLANTPPSYLNFIVLEYQNGDEEVLLGWATSTYKGMEQRAYTIRDKRMIAYFRDYHGQLYMLTTENAS